MPETESSSFLDRAMHTRLSRRNVLGLVGTGIAGAALSGCGSSRVEPIVLPRSSTRIGGVWTKPPDNAVFTQPEMEACAVPKRGEGAPEISHVNFTADSKNPDNPGWQTESVLNKPNDGEQYCAFIDLRKITDSNNPNPQTVTISFDVYNKGDGSGEEVKLAPEGERQEIYAPQK